MPALRSLTLAFASLAPFAAYAVVATTSKTILNSADGVWDFVGQMHGGSAVAIDAYHVLTAGHVAAGDFLLGDSEYHMSWTAIDPSADLRIVTVDEALPGWYDVASSVKKGAAVTMVGYGQSGVVNDDGNGYKLTAGGTRRAGGNTIASLQDVADYGPTLHSMLGRAGDAALTSGDSGGGWFVGGKLVGISDYTFTMNTKKAEYGFAKNAYFGSGAIDLANASVRSWILSQTSLGPRLAPQAVPEPSLLASVALGMVAVCRKRRG